MARPWCVGWRWRDADNRPTGPVLWCAAADQSRQPNADAWTVRTACDQYVVLPLGCERQRPTCTICRKRMAAYRNLAVALVQE